MLSKNELNEIENWVLATFPTNKCDHFTSNKFKKRMKTKYGLKLVANDGVSRTVYKKPYSKEVVKFSYFIQNIAEHEVWKAYENTEVSNGLAACYQISKGGMVLTQEYMSQPFPHDRDYSEPWHAVYWGKEFEAIKTAIANVFETDLTHSSDVEDFHQSNMLYNSKGEVKIVDYASVAEHLTTKYYLSFTKTNAQRIRGEIARSLKKSRVPNKQLTMGFFKDVLYVTTDMQDTSMRLALGGAKPQATNC